MRLTRAQDLANGIVIMGIDPVTARVGLRTAREVISGRQISYPVPYLLVILSLLCVACLVIAMFARDTVQVIALVLGCGAFALGAAVLVVAIIFKPELLRSERHEQVMRLIDIVGDSEMGPTDRANLVTAVLGEVKGRSGTRLGEHHD